MLTIVVWTAGAIILLYNIWLRTRILRLEARLRELGNPQQQLAYLRKQNAQGNKVAAIKALRKQYPEISLIDANRMYQNL